MSNKTPDQNPPVEGFKNEATRRRWELFHRAIAHAKQSNVNALQEERDDEKSDLRAQLQSVAR
jgi:hypothetical protein